MIAIIIPIYNAEAYLAQAIESVIAQSYKDWHLIVLDDGSQDGSFAIAQRYAQRDARIQAYTQINSGVAITRNNGLKLAGASQFVMFLDNDDYLDPQALTTLHAALLAAPEAVAAYGLSREVQQDGSIGFMQPIDLAYGFQRYTITPDRKMAPMEPTAPDQFANLVLWPSVLTPGQMLIRADVLTQIEPFDPVTVPSDDWDLCIRLSLHGPLQRVLHFTLNKRDHTTNVSKQGKVMAVAEPRIRSKLATSPALSKEMKRIARLGHRYSCWYKMSWAKDDLRRRDLIGAAKKIYRGLKSYSSYLRA